MDHFIYKNGELFAEDVPLTKIAEEVGTPVYVYSTATFERHFEVFSEALSGLDTLVCYAVKANSNIAVLRTLGKLGAGADVVSAGELMRALRAGIPADKIVFSGVGKTSAEMALGLEVGIKQFNVEGESELARLDRVAGQMGVTARVSLRVNPDVDAKTHEKISTGKAENKFGIPWSRIDATYQKISESKNLKAVGVDVHIGSQLTDLEPFEAAYRKVLDLVAKLRAEGHAIDHIDLGGGLGIPYQPGEKAPPSPEAYAAMVQRVFADFNGKLIFEPGRLIAGNAGILLTSLIYEKTGEERTFYVLDAAMNDLARPSLYDAYHDIVPVNDMRNQATAPADFVGPVCETGDTFAKGRPIAPLQEGDLIAIRSAGAYGAVMASTYNSRPLVPEVLVNGDKYHVIRPRQSLEDLLGLDDMPDWLSSDEID